MQRRACARHCGSSGLPAATTPVLAREADVLVVWPDGYAEHRAAVATRRRLVVGRR